MPKVKPAPVVAAIADDPIAKLAAARDHLAEAERAVADRKVDFDTDTTALQIAVDKATAAAVRVGAGEDVDPKESARLKMTVALAREAVDFSRTALVEARRLAAAAALEVKKALLAVLDRRAKRKYLPQAEAERDHALAAAAFVTTSKAVLAARADQMAAAAEAEGLRAELRGIDPSTTPYVFPHELEIRRAMSALPVEWLRDAGNGGFPVGDVNFLEIADRTLLRAAA